MGFDDLPPEIVLKIFHYLPQDFLEEVIARVSRRWKNLAFDPSLYTVVCIYSGHGDSPQRALKILERATMLRTLQITLGAADLDIGASASAGLRNLNHLVIPGSAISRRAMSGIAEHCESLSTIVLYGQYRLTATEVRILETLPSLRRFITWDDVEISDHVLQQLCHSCPRIEILEINTQHISSSESWAHLGSLRYLRILAVNIISTVDLLYVSEYCPFLQTLEIKVAVNENDISMSEALQGFQELRSLRVILQCGQGWLEQQFGVPPLLHSFKVPHLVLEEEQLHHLVVSFNGRLQHIEVDVSRVPDASLCALSFCTRVKFLNLYGVTGKTIFFQILCHLHSITRVSLYIVAHPDDAVFQLMSIVDQRDRSPRGRTRLVCNVLSSSPEAQDNIMGAATAFRDHLALHTSMTWDHIMDFKRQCLRCGQVTGPPWKVQTSFPTVIPTLQYLTLHLDGV